MLTTHSFKRSFAAGLLAAGICILTSGNALAGNCGCEPTCAACPVSPSMSCDCSGGCSSPGSEIGRAVKKSCVYKALDAFAGGVEKLLGLDKCGGGGGCDELTCDDGCDAAMINELMTPAVEHHHHQHHLHSVPTVPAPVYPSPAPRHSAPIHSAPIESVPLKEVQITPTGPSQWQQPRVMPQESEMRMSEPRMVQPRTPSPGQHLGDSSHPTLEESRMPIPEPEPRVPEAEMPAPKDDAGDGGSLFDALSNPFSDDEARVHVPQPIRPSSYQSKNSDYNMRPISKRKLSRSYSESTRRVRSVR